MIFVTGDCHSDFRRFAASSFPEQKEMTREDYVIICGDFGGVWYQKGYSAFAKSLKTENYWLDWLENKPFTTLFVDGNHECFDRLYEYPVKSFHGGLVHEIRPHVLHLMRGEVFELQGYKFFAFGGASSHDIQDGILNPDDFADPDNFKDTYKRWKKQRKMFRVKGWSWWEQELPSEKEKQHGIEILERCNWDVDFVVSHCAPQNVVSVFSHELYKPDDLTMYFNSLLDKGLKFNAWLFGHYHDNQKIMSKFVMIYDQIIRII